MSVSVLDALNASTATGSSNTATSAKREDCDPFYEELKAYFFKSPTERLFDNWLAVHKISKEEYAQMPPEKKAALQKQFAEQIQRETERKAKILS